MPDRDDLQLEWWKLACGYNPDPISFVNVKSKFIFSNTAWCELVGWSESELREKTWMEITKHSDVGGDQAEVDKLISGEKKDYYIEKVYLRKDGSEVTVHLYVHRFPEYGDIEGFIVFARRRNSKEYEDLKSRFFELHKTVLLLQQNSLIYNSYSQKIEKIENELVFTKDILKVMMNKNGNINIGDQTGGDHIGRDKIANQSKMMMFLAGVCVFVTIALVVIVLGGQLNLRHNNSSIEINPNAKQIDK